MGRGARGKRFRKTVAGIPTAVFRNRLAAQTYRHGLRLFAVNPAYTSAWGDQHWRTPYENVTRHEAAATVIGRRAQGFKARRREGVTRTRPEDRVVRATDQAAPDDRQVSTRNRHRPGIRGTESRPPSRARTRLPGPGNRYPGTANDWPATSVASVTVILVPVSTSGFDVNARLGTVLTAMVTPFGPTARSTRCRRQARDASGRLRLRRPGAVRHHRRVADDHRRREARAAAARCWRRSATAPGSSRARAPTTPRTACTSPRRARPRARTACWS